MSAEPLPGVASDLNQSAENDLGLQSAIQEPDALYVDAGENRLQHIATREMSIPGIDSRVSNVRSADKSERWIKVRLQLLDGEATPPTRVVRHVDAKPERRALAVQPFRVRSLKPGIGLQHAAAGQTRIQVTEVDANQRVVAIGVRVAVGRDHAHAGFLEHVRRSASHEHGAGIRGLELILTDRERADVPASHAAAELAASLEVDRSSRWAQAQPA